MNLKKVFAFLLCLCMIFALSACGGSSSGSASSGGSSEPEPPAEPAVELTDPQYYFGGDWYGWWGLTDATGNAEDLEGAWYDCLAKVEVDESSATEEGVNARILIADEVNGFDDPLADIDIFIDPDGYAVGKDGFFFFDDAPLDVEFVIDDVFNYIAVRGAYVSDDATFNYTMLLGYWGHDWSDMEEGMRPYFFDDWYLPLIESDADMPDELPANAN